jgi:hypothetical protein
LLPQLDIVPVDELLCSFDRFPVVLMHKINGLGDMAIGV